MATSVESRARAQALEALGDSFKHALAAVRRLRGRETHRPGALTQAQYQVLFELLGGELPASELAAVAEVSPASMTQMLDRLADAGLIERARSHEDRRIVAARLTEAGRAACERRRAAYEPLWRDALSEFNPAELRTAATVLDRLTDLIERLDDGHPEP